jgi:mono/diheme cytochrome c family protein
MALSANSANELRAIINANLAVPAAPPGVQPAPPDFCAIWPTAKPILQTLAGVVILIPGFGAAAAAALTALIAAGQVIFDQTCHP